MPITKRDLLKMLADLPDDAPIVLDAEGGVDFVGSVGIVSIRKAVRDWSSTPVGNYRIVDGDDECTGAAMPAILISLDRHAAAGVMSLDTFERLATICMLLKCVEADAHFQREAGLLLAEIPPDERVHCEVIVREDWRTDDVLKQCIDETRRIDRYHWLIGELK